MEVSLLSTIYQLFTTLIDPAEVTAGEPPEVPRVRGSGFSDMRQDGRHHQLQLTEVNATMWSRPLVERPERVRYPGRRWCPGHPGSTPSPSSVPPCWSAHHGP